MDDPSCPRDEYEACIGPTLRRLQDGASIEEIADYLESVVSESMGLDLGREQTERPHPEPVEGRAPPGRVVQGRRGGVIRFER